MDARLAVGGVLGEEFIEEFLHWANAGDTDEVALNLVAGGLIRDEIERLRARVKELEGI
jgi:hypothetical protein